MSYFAPIECVTKMVDAGESKVLHRRNEIPTVIGNLIGGLTFTGLTLYATHLETAPKRIVNTGLAFRAEALRARAGSAAPSAASLEGLAAIRPRARR